MARVFITGGSGFVGRALQQEYIKRGDTVVATATESKGAYVACDIADAADIMRAVADADPDIVIHSAAISTTVHPQALDYYSVNVLGTKNVLAAVKTLRKRTRVVFLSTAGVYGNQPTEVLHEELVPTPVHDYGMSKLCSELWVKYFAEFCDFTIVRPFNIIGPAQNALFVVPKLASAFGRGERRINLGNIDVCRDYVDIKTSATIIADLASNPLAIGEVVNLCSGEGTSLRMLIEAFQRVAGYEIEIVRDPALVRSNEVWCLIGSREKLERLAPGAPVSKSAQEMAQEMYDFYKSQNRPA